MPDTTTRIQFTADNTRLDPNGVQYIINPYDELALTRALEITEASGGTVTVVHVGLADAEPVIRKALAMGANDAIRVDAFPEDAMFVARQIADVAKAGAYDLVFTGRESIDFNGGMVAGMVAEFLQWPLLNVVTKIDIAGTQVTAIRDIDGGKETLTCALPCVASAQKELTEPRIPNMRGIMAARTKPIQVVAPQGSANTKNVKFELPAPKGACKIIQPDQAGTLIDLLHSEAKVI